MHRAHDDRSAAISSQYGVPGLIDRIDAALREAGRNPAALTRADVAGFEEFHTRGRLATLELARLANIGADDRVLDIGAGLGGPARTLAAELGCRVTGLDLVEEYCRAATVLTERLGLTGFVDFRRGDALEPPFEDASFDVVCFQHATMNIADKRRLFREVRRVLRPGGRLALHEIFAGAVRPEILPAPWADAQELSFLPAQAEVRRLLETMGLRERVWNDVSEGAIDWFRTMLANAAAAARRPDSPPPLGLNLLMGGATREKVGNLLRNLVESRVTVVQAVFDA